MNGDVCFTFAEMMKLKQEIFDLNRTIAITCVIVGFIIAKIPDAINWYQDKYGIKS